jgi:uncharacterized membrane protein
VTLWGAAAAGLGLVAYSLLSYVLMAYAPDQAWTVLALFGPVLAGLALAGLHRRHGPTLVGCAVLALVLVVVWRRGGVDVNRLFVLQHAVMLGLFGWVFALTLRPGAKALITAMAEHVHLNPIPPAVRAYTRRLTVVWVWYFFGMIAVSLAVYAWAPWPWWSFFCAVVTPGVAVAVFVVEYLWRRWRHPDFEPVSFQRALNAWRHIGPSQQR